MENKKPIIRKKLKIKTANISRQQKPELNDTLMCTQKIQQEMIIDAP